MRTCYLLTSGERAEEIAESRATLATRWARVLAADRLTLGELRVALQRTVEGETAVPYQIALADARLASSEALIACRQLLDGVAGCKLVLHLEHALPTDEQALAAWRTVLALADLVLAPHYAICLDVQRKLGIRVCDISAPFSVPQDPRPRVRAGRRTLTVVARPGYRRWDMAREIGFSTYLVTLVRYRIVIVSPDALAARRDELLDESDLVYLPEAIEDGGALAAGCATAGAVLIANGRYAPAKVTFPYTTFDTGHRLRRMSLFFWIHTAPDFVEFFRDNARRSAVLLSPENRRVQLVRQLQYRFPDQDYEPRSSAGGSLLDQIHHKSGPRRIDYAEDECIAVCLVRNGQEHLPSFLRHHRALGIRHFVFVDNGSDDATLAMLDGQPDVTVYETALQHKYYETEMRRLIIEEHCRHRFCLNIDIDELFDYPHSDRLGLKQLLAYLRRRGATAMAAYMLDMYAKEVSFTAPEALDLKTAYPYYDVSNIKVLDYHTSHIQAYCDHNVLLANHVKCYFGGIRETLFKSKPGGHYLLTKHPLIYLDGTLEPVTNPHYCNKATVADVTGVLRHYKFTASFKDKVGESRATKRYIKFAQNQYDEYHRKIGGKSSIRIDTPATRRLEHVDQLVAEGFISISPAFEEFERRMTRAATLNSPEAPAEVGTLGRAQPHQTLS
jgi:hypothetical protein